MELKYNFSNDIIKNRVESLKKQQLKELEKDLIELKEYFYNPMLITKRNKCISESYNRFKDKFCKIKIIITIDCLNKLTLTIDEFEELNENEYILSLTTELNKSLCK